MPRTVLVNDFGYVVNVILADESFVTEFTHIVTDDGGIGQVYDYETGLFSDVIEPEPEPVEETEPAAPVVETTSKSTK
jgi:hypothetical protein